MKVNQENSFFSKTFLLLLLCLTLTWSSWAKISVFMAAEYAKGQEDTSFSLGSFQRPQLGASFAEAINPQLDFYGQFYLVGRDEIQLDEAWLRWRFSSKLTTIFGLYLVPFGYYNENSLPYQSSLIRQPLTYEYILPYRWRDMGVVVLGSWGDFSYWLYLGNGLTEASSLAEGQQFIDHNRNKAIGGKITWELGQGFQLGYSRQQGKYDDQGQRQLVLDGYHLAWRGKNSSLIGEYILGSLEVPSAFAQGKAKGIYLQASLTLFGLRPVVSFQEINYRDEFHGPGFTAPSFPGQGIDWERQRWTLGLIYPLVDKVYFKFEYDWNKNRKDETKKDDTYFFQVTLVF
ncbi:MAG TPA: hypothetical protein ENF17_00345 [Candidatus Aminicenantes bacterium]|nr:hypothetical protein [Candidatus Aminicenantes bacterium]